MDIDRFLASNDGVVSLDQARECGLSDKQVQARVRHGEWLRRASEVYFATAWTWTPAARVRVAGVWAGPRGALASITAAWWLGLPVDGPSPLTVVLPHGSSRRPPPFVTVRQRDLGPDRQEHRGLPVTSTALTVLDAAVALGPAGPAFLDRALQEHVDLDTLRRAQNRHLGRRGSPAAGRLLARAGDRAASEPERRLLSLLKSAGVTGWQVNVEIILTDGRRTVLDVAFPDVRFVIGVDGWAHHVDHDALSACSS